MLEKFIAEFRVVKMVEPPRMKAMHLTNTLHLLGRELHADLTDDLARREDARRFEDLLRAPLRRGKNRTMPLFPAPMDLAVQCGDCAVQTVKKPFRKLRGKNRLKPKKSTSVLSIEKKISQIRIETTNQMNGDISNALSGENGKFRLKRMPRKAAESGESVVITETSRHLPCGFQHEIQVHRHLTKKSDRKKKMDKIGSNCNLKTAKEPDSPLELNVEIPETSKTKLDIRRKPDVINSKPQRNLEMYAPAELHYAADSAGRAIHNALKAMNKLILLAPKDSVDHGFLKSIALMCAFLRQFYLELKSRRDRKSKLEVILRLWHQLQLQSTPPMPLPTPPAEPVDGKNNMKEKNMKKK